jgi:AraC-like DNA-binding protein
VVPRFIATASTGGRREAEWLLRSAGAPNALRDPETARIPSSCTYRLWGAVLARTGRRDAGLLAAARYRPGLLHVFDYLLSSAPTAGEGLARACAHLHLVSSNSVLSTREHGDEVTISYGVRHGEDELRDVVTEFALALVTGQLRHATGTELSALRVGFAHRAPRRPAGHAAAFGSAEIEFGARADAITLHRSDLERPLVTADPALAAIMLRAAAAAPPPRICDTAALPGLHEVIAAQLPCGRPSLAEAARRLTISTRTLQRRLSESGTTWRAELDAVRREQADGLRYQGAGPAQRAARLGFAESRSLRRAMSRWDSGARESGYGEREPARASREPVGAARASVDAGRESGGAARKSGAAAREMTGGAHELTGTREAGTA